MPPQATSNKLIVTVMVEVTIGTHARLTPQWIPGRRRREGIGR